MREAIISLKKEEIIAFEEKMAPGGAYEQEKCARRIDRAGADKRIHIEVFLRFKEEYYIC